MKMVKIPKNVSNSKQGLRKDHLRILCENSGLAELPNNTSKGSFVVSDMMLEAVLIYGVMKCATTMETYYGPCLLPKKVKHFT